MWCFDGIIYLRCLHIQVGTLSKWRARVYAVETHGYTEELPVPSDELQGCPFSAPAGEGKNLGQSLASPVARTAEKGGGVLVARIPETGIPVRAEKSPSQRCGIP